MKYLFICLVRIYQLAISPLTGKNCRFYPTCSRYAIIAIDQHGAWRGSWLTIKRILRCRPGCEGGIDLVPTIDELKQDCACHKN